MAKVVWTGHGEGHIDYGISHRWFRISTQDGSPWGAVGRLNDPYEIALIEAALDDLVVAMGGPSGDCGGEQ